jgi:hypothetical protein
MRAFILATTLLVFASVAEGQVVIQRSGPGGRVTMGGPAPGPLGAAPAGFGVSTWRVGEWARYSVSSGGGNIPLTQIRTVSVVGQQGDRFWVETQEEFAGPMTTRGPVRKMLIPFGTVRDAVGTEAYTLLPDSSVRKETLLRAPTGSAAESFAFPRGWERVGEEDVTVPAGALKAVHWRKGEEHLWTSAEVGPLGVVKYQSTEVTIELGSRGTGAKSRIPFGG